MSNLQELFEKTENSRPQSNGPSGLYKVSAKKLLPGKKSYTATLRILPNVTRNLESKPFQEKKIYHYINLQDYPELKGQYDSPTNFDRYANCELSTLGRAINKAAKAGNVIAKSREDAAPLTIKNYSYVLVVKDEQQPELVGKIMVLEYGKSLYDIFQKYLNGFSEEVMEQNEDGEEVEVKREVAACDIYSLTKGKDFNLNVFWTDENKPATANYTKSSFSNKVTPAPIVSETGKITRIELTSDGKIADQKAVAEFLLSREYNIEDYSTAHELTEKQKENIEKIKKILLHGIATDATSKAASVLASDKAEETEEDFFA